MTQFDSFIMYNVDKTDRELLLNSSCHVLNKTAKPAQNTPASVLL